MQHVKNVHHLPDTNILIDFWKPSEKRRNFFRFMTVFRLTDEQLRYIKDNDYKIYTSCLNRDLLERHEIPANRIVAIESHNSIKINDEVERYFFKVSVIDSNYCIGSCMFLFQGPFGTILYTGFFRPAKACYPLYSSVLAPLIQDRLIDVVYVDNSYAGEHCKFPSRAEVIEQTIDLIKEHPDYKIIISGKRFGKEEILRDIAVSINEKIGISEEKYAILSPIMTHLRNFSVDREKCRIIVEDELFSLKQCKEKLVMEGTSIIILLTARYICEENRTGNPVPRLSNMYILPYSSHASHCELMNFLYHLKARSIKPIILDQCENTIIPQNMLDLCFTDEDSAPLRDSDYYFDSYTDALSDVDEINDANKTLVQVTDSPQSDNNISNVNDTTLREEMHLDDTSVQIPVPQNNDSTTIDTEELGSENSDVFYESQTSAFRVFIEEQEEEILAEGSDPIEARDPLSLSSSDMSVINNSLPIDSNVSSDALSMENLDRSTIDDSLPIDSNTPDVLPSAESISARLDNNSIRNSTLLENDVQNLITPKTSTSALDNLLLSDEKMKSNEERFCGSDQETVVEKEQTCSAEIALETEHNNNELNSQLQTTSHDKIFSEEILSSDILVAGSDELVDKQARPSSVESMQSEIQNQYETESNISLALSDRSDHSDQQLGDLIRQDQQDNEEFANEEERQINFALYHHWLKMTAEDGQQSILDSWKDFPGEFYPFYDSS